MNRFLTHEGRQPVWLNDIDFIQDSVNSEVLKIVEGLTGGIKDKVIISGCDISADPDIFNFDISEGIILYNGILYRIDAASYDSLPYNEFFVKFETEYDPEGDRQLKESGDIVKCYSKPVAMFDNRSGIPLNDFTRINSVIYSDILRYNDAKADVKLVKQNTQYFFSVQFNGKFKGATIKFSNYDVVRDLAQTEEDYNHLPLPSYGVASIVRKNSSTGSLSYGFANVSVGLYYSNPLVVNLRLGLSGSYVDLIDTSDDIFYGGFTMVLNRL